MPSRWTAASPVIVRGLQLDDVLLMMEVDSAVVVEVTGLTIGVEEETLTNEHNAIELLRFSSNGVGGNAPTLEKMELGAGANNGLADIKVITDTGWTTEPTVSDVLGGGRPFNLSHGFRWPRHSGESFVLGPGDTFGCRIVRVVSGVMNWHVQLDYNWIGG